VLDVFGVRFQLGDHLVVELVRLVPERLLAFQNDHGRAVRVEFLEYLTDALHRDHRRRRIGGHRHRLHLADLFELRDDDVQDGDDGDPAEDDRYGQPTDRPRQERPCRVPGGWESVGRRLGL
jgi:hypothetical protein